MKIRGKTILSWCIENTLKAKSLNKVIVAAPHKIPLRLSVPVFIGDENNVLKRYFDCATAYGIDIVVRITADCPFIDPEIIDAAVDYFKKHNFKYVCFAPIDGLDVEVFSYQLLQEANKMAVSTYDKEHVTPYMRRVTKLSIDTRDDLKTARIWYGLGR